MIASQDNLTQLHDDVGAEEKSNDAQHPAQIEDPLMNHYLHPHTHALATVDRSSHLFLNQRTMASPEIQRTLVSQSPSG